MTSRSGAGSVAGKSAARASGPSAGFLVPPPPRPQEVEGAVGGDLGASSRSGSLVVLVQPAVRAQEALLHHVLGVMLVSVMR